MEELMTVSPAAEAGAVSTAPAAAQSVPEPANVFAFGPDDPVDGDHEAAQAGEEAPAPEANGSEAQAPEGADDRQPVDQKKVNRAFSQEAKRQRRMYEEQLRNDPDRMIGRRLVEDLMAREQLTEAQAREALDQRFVAARARRENASEELVRDIERLKQITGIQDIQTPDASEQESFDADQMAAEIKEEIGRMELPDGFDPDAAYADQAFAELLLEMPIKAAVRVYAAERKAANAPKDIAEKLRARQQIPQAERPNAPVSPQVNYLDMSSDDFFKEKARRERQMR